MNKDEKSRLLELLKELGHDEECADFKQEQNLDGLWVTTLLVIFPDGRKIHGVGCGCPKAEADKASARVVLNLIHENHKDLLVDWTQIEVEAQAGDALIKLCVYLSSQFETVSEKSEYLQKWEKDEHLSFIFDRWKFKKDPDLAVWGNGLGKKRKATIVEALLWRRFNKLVFNADIAQELELLLKELQVPELNN